MKKFEFYQDVKVTSWIRQGFTIEAESKEEALKMVERYKFEDVEKYENINNSEFIYDYTESISVDENNGFHTIELYDGETNELIGMNSK